MIAKACSAGPLTVQKNEDKDAQAQPLGTTIFATAWHIDCGCVRCSSAN